MSAISVVIPAYNEESRIGNSLKEIVHFFSDSKRFSRYEIIVVDDGSTDNTKGVVAGFEIDEIKLLKNDGNRGKGYSVKKGVLQSQYPLILFSDSDLSTPIHELDKLVGSIDEGYDIAIGSRNLDEDGVTIERSFSRTLISKGFNRLVSLLALRGFRDTQCGFKLFTADAIKDVVQYQRLNGFTFDVEILFLAKKFGYKIREVSVLWSEDRGSKVKPVKDGVKMLLDLIRIRCMNTTGKYDRT